MSRDDAVIWLYHHWSWARNLVRRRIWNPSDTEDVLQEAVVSILQKHAVPIDVGGLFRYWSGVLKRTALWYQRRSAARSTSLHPDALATLEASPATAPDLALDRASLRVANGELEVLRLRFSTTMSREQVALALGYSAASVRGIERRALARLRADRGAA
jgi:DNA-directed RNA polymerase specialized sigma24 family protein